MKSSHTRSTVRTLGFATHGVLVTVFLALFTWLNYQADAIMPGRHEDYVRNLRELRELEARIDREVLASRQDLTRNYDALTRHAAAVLQVTALLRTPPPYLSAADQIMLAREAAELATKVQAKTEVLDRFKRENAVLRNSLAYFPVAAEALLDDEVTRIHEVRPATFVSHYVRHVLMYARSPGDEDRLELQPIRQALVARAAQLKSADTRRMIDNLLLHGDVILGRMPELDRLTLEALSPQVGAWLGMLNHDYDQAHVRATQRAARYRIALYAMALLLVAYLAWAFLGLTRARRSLEQAHRELNQRYQTQLAVEKQLMLHATAFRSAHDGITLTDATGNILDVNPAFTRITGWERSEVIGKNPRVLKSGRHDAAFYAAMWQSILETGNWRGEIWNRNKYGEVYPELLSISTVNNEAGQLTNYVAVFADIRRLKAQENQLKQMAYYDALTELPNRALLADRLDQAIAQTRRTQTQMAVCYLDLDGFKPINDTWGHEAGDKVLIDIANRLKSALRGGDTVARLGGDEFALLLLGLASVDECEEAIKRLLAQINQPLTCLPEPTPVSASIGVTLFPHDDADNETLLRHADQSMYLAKQAGKNRHHLFDAEQDRSARSRQDRLFRIRQALEEHEFILHYQPKVDMRAGRVIGAEALIRWQHPERGLLPPGEFLPLIEDDELVKMIGDWVIETALAQLQTWHAAGLDIAVSVNIAGKQLQAPEFVEKLKVALYLHPDVARHLELEVLETAALEDVVKTSRVIDECRLLGVQFSLDDFGTGYSSLTYLKRLPAEIIKIDQSFVREILSDHNNLVIVQGVIGLAQAFQRQIIAEGVESVEHGRLLLQLDCDQAQGYGIARPMPAAEIVAWARHWRPDPSWAPYRASQWDDSHYPTLIAEIQLRNWVAQLDYAANEGLPPPQQYVGDPHCCQFGRWYDHSGQARYAVLPSFAALKAPHERLHAVAAQMDQCWREGQADEMRALVPELLAARDATLIAMTNLQLAVGTLR